MEIKGQHLMRILICHCHLLYDLLEILIGSFHCAIHLWPIWRRVVMLYLELRAGFGDHLVFEIDTIVYDNPFEDVVSANEIMFDESSHDILGNRCERGCFYPLGKVIDSNEDETMPIRSSRFDFSNHINAPTSQRPKERLEHSSEPEAHALYQRISGICDKIGNSDSSWLS